METLVKARKTVFIDYKYLVGLCAYIRQADLSIDRCRWTSWKELRSFYNGRKEEVYISNYFLDLCKNLGLTPQYHELKNRSSGFNYVISVLRFGLLGRRHWVAIEELETIYYLLNSFKQMLLNDHLESKDIEELRLRLVTYYSNILLPRLKRQDAARVLKIEHYLQNENLQTVSLSEIANL